MTNAQHKPGFIAQQTQTLVQSLWPRAARWTAQRYVQQADELMATLNEIATNTPPSQLSLIDHLDSALNSIEKDRGFSLPPTKRPSLCTSQNSGTAIVTIVKELYSPLMYTDFDALRPDTLCAFLKLQRAQTSLTQSRAILRICAFALFSNKKAHHLTQAVDSLLKERCPGQTSFVKKARTCARAHGLYRFFMAEQGYSL